MDIWEKSQVERLSLILSLNIYKKTSCPCKNYLRYLTFTFYIIYTDILVPSVCSQGTFCQAFHMGTVLSEDGRSCTHISKDTHTSKDRTQLLVCQVMNTTSALDGYV